MSSRSGHTWLSRGLALLTVALMPVLVAACNTPQATSTPEAPADILAMSKEAMTQLTSYRFSGEISGADEEGPQSTVQTGEWVSPDRLHLKFVGNDYVSEIIVVGDQAYVYDSAFPEQGWLLLPMAAPTSGPFFVESLDNPELLEEEVSVSDIPTLHIKGVLPVSEEQATQAEAMIPQDDPFREERLASIARRKTTIELFIDKNDYRILRAIIDQYTEGWETGRDAEEVETFRATPINTRTTTNYFDFNASIAIEAPG